MERENSSKRDQVSLTDSSILRLRRDHPLVPTRDETAGLTGGGIVGILVVWYLNGKGVTVPAEVAAAIGTVAAQVVHYIVSFLPRRRR